MDDTMLMNVRQRFEKRSDVIFDVLRRHFAYVFSRMMSFEIRKNKGDLILPSMRSEKRYDVVFTSAEAFQMDMRRKMGN